MLKTTLYGAVVGGLFAAATVATPVIAAPAAPSAPHVEKNVNAARNLGFTALHFKTPQELRRQLADLNVL